MTTGNWTRDNRATEIVYSRNSCTSSPIAHAATVGRRESRQWQGADAPKSSFTVSPAVGFAYYYPVYKRGKRVGWKKRVKLYRKRVYAPSSRGEHAYTMTYIDFNGATYTRYHSCPTPGTAGYPVRTTMDTTNGFLPVNRAPSWPANRDISLYGKLRERIQGSSFNLAVTLGEGKESLQTIADSATRIYKSMKALKKGRPMDAWRALVTGRPDRYRKPGGLPNVDPRGITTEWLSKNWLQLQYGWMPLINDCYEAARHLAYLLHSKRNQTYRVSMFVEPTTKPVYTSVYRPTTFTCRTRKSIVARVSEVDEVGLVGLKDPASLAWELLPYSFVVDWFIPISNYLSARDLSRRISGTFITSMLTQSELSGLEQGAGLTGGQSTYCKYVTMTRTVSNVLPRVDLPTVKPFGKIATWKHAASAISLLLARFAT